MPISALSRLVIAAALSCAIAGCQSAIAIDGAGYQLVRFADPKAARAASQDAMAGPAIAANNARCRADLACRK